MKKIWWIYLLLLAPTLTEFLESGSLPDKPRDMITDVVMTIFMGIFILIIYRGRRRLILVSETDELTGLKNRHAFQKELASAVAKAHRLHITLSLAIIDIDQFKFINDSYGHHKGDQILAKIGKLLKDSVRSQIDICYRVGGDEFAILLPAIDLSGTEGIDRRIEALRDRGSELLEPYRTGLSVGVASLGDGESPDDLFKRADSRMYREKKAN